jgi:NTP pyrophosphatase (non-canonical NTP hydrolase)
MFITTELRDLAQAIRERCSGDGKAAMLVAGRYADILSDAALKLETKANFQSETTDWATQCFGKDHATDTTLRNHRFLEEAVELVQACGITRIEVLQIVHYVYNRPVGVIRQEVGGVLNTLAVLCSAFGIDMLDAGNEELMRVWNKFEEIRAKHHAKPKFSSEGE